MSRLKRRIVKIAAGIEESFDTLALAFRRRLHTDKEIQIVTYRSYGTTNKLYVKGRVLKDKGLVKPVGRENIWNNILNMYKRFQSDEIPGAALQINFEGKVYELVSDYEGYFSIHLTTDSPVEWNDMWYEIDVEMVGAPFGFTSPVKEIAEVLVPPPDAEYGIISDIDDTVIKTSATSLLAMSRNTFFHNAHSRLPFAGVSEFYKSLQSGRNGKRNNPFFYVSSSPWNLYDLLVDFLDLNEIPAGPLLLRDFGLSTDGKTREHMAHKLHEITNILDTYPPLKFVLIGDSGQEDASIYREVVSRFPGRILAVYIRDVQLTERERIAVDISKSMLDDGVEMIIVDNTVEAAEHAARTGLIYNDALPKVAEDKRKDKGEIEGKVEL
jgi:phosphatidate phosphatase APP1